MKISEISKKFSSGKTPGRGFLGRFKLSGPDFKIRPEYFLWAIFALVVIFEIYALYAYAFRNLFFAVSVNAEQVNTAAVRINSENYERVIRRIDRASDYNATSTIDFAGRREGVGRANPFAEPE